MTATSRSVISDIHKLSRQLSSVDIPRPLAMFCTLFRLRPPSAGYFGQFSDAPLFEALRVWNDIGDICESESFDGHRKTIVEHTLNLLLLPGIHCNGMSDHRGQTSSDSLVASTSPIITQPHHPSNPSLPIPGTSLSVPSPLHFQLHIITRLSFNEQGRVTHHRDFWDVKDVIGLVPGVPLAQWVATRLAARGLSCVSRLWTSNKSPISVEHNSQVPEITDLERGSTPAVAYIASTKNALGLMNI